MHYYAVNFVFYVSFRRGSKRKKNTQKKKGHFERSSLFCLRPFPETTFLERPRCRGAVLSSKKEKGKKERKKEEKAKKEKEKEKREKIRKNKKEFYLHGKDQNLLDYSQIS